MLSLSKKTDYALIALTYLAEHSEQVASAREIAGAYHLPQALLMNILKALHSRGVLASTRGTKGGYKLAIDPTAVSLFELIEIIDGPIQLAQCVMLEDGVLEDEKCQCKVASACPIQAPIRALHHRLIRFLKEVKVADLIMPGHRIDVPLELVGVG